MNRIIITALIIVNASAAIQAQTLLADAGADSLTQAKKHFSFAVQYKNNGEYEQAIGQYRESFAWTDSMFQVHFSFADLLLEMNRREEARVELNRTLELNPDHYKSASLLAQMLHDESDYDSLLVMYETMQRIQPNIELLTTIAGLKAYLRDFEGAFTANQQLIAAGDRSAQRFGYAAQYGLLCGELVLADAYINAALDLEPDNSTYIERAARIKLGRGTHEEAYPLLWTLADADPPNGWAIDTLEQSARENNDTTTLIQSLEYHHRLAPEDSTVTGELVELLYHYDTLERAAEIAREGLEYSPGDGQLHIILGEYHRHKGDKDAALTEYRKALTDSSWSESARQFILQIQHPATDAEQAEREFFNRGRHTQQHQHTDGDSQ